MGPCRAGSEDRMGLAAADYLEVQPCVAIHHTSSLLSLVNVDAGANRRGGGLIFPLAVAGCTWLHLPAKQSLSIMELAQHHILARLSSPLDSLFIKSVHSPNSLYSFHLLVALFQHSSRQAVQPRCHTSILIQRPRRYRRGN